MSTDNWKPMFDFLEHEARFQGLAAAATGAAAAWWLKALLAPEAGVTSLSHPVASRLAAGLLTIAAFLFLISQGRLAKKYGELACYLALNQEVPTEWSSNVVREFWKWDTVMQWFPYYAARAVLLVVGFVLIWMLFA
ncbi:MAG TPA: hypothetical protein VHG28_22005 [Longimicrobiaceae bacterium]|nr:hypothetical protein [Longimicrobiaceae bacterium]